MNKPSTRYINTSNLSIYSEIEDEYKSLADGVSSGGNICPRCKGGRTKEGSFGVTREGNLLKFKCHRASCEFSGVTTLTGGRPVPEGTSTEQQRKSYRSSYADVGKGPLPEPVVSFLGVHYGITPVTSAKGKLQWTTEFSPQGQGRVLMPVFDENGLEYGYTVRKYDDQPGPKTLSFVQSSKGSWYNGPATTKTRQLIVVEDQLSALRASHYLNSVALLGTHVTDNALSVLKERQYDTVYLALDPDAFPVSIRMARRLREAGVKVRVLKLTKDIKNMNEIELIDWLNEVEINWYE